MINCDILGVKEIGQIMTFRMKQVFQKTLEFLSFKFIVLMLVLFHMKFVSLTAQYTLHSYIEWADYIVWMWNVEIAIWHIYLIVVWIEDLWPHIISAKLFYSAVIQADCHTVCKVNHSVYKLLIIVQAHRSVCLFHPVCTKHLTLQCCYLDIVFF